MAANALQDRVAKQLAVPVRPEIAEFAAALARKHDARAVLFYGSNLRSGSLDGMLDFYVLTDGARERGLWPRVGYHEHDAGGTTLRAKVAAMNLATFAHAAAGLHADTTIWARFVQPVTLAWCAGEPERAAVSDAIAQAIRTAARFAAALGPDQGPEEEFWLALFRATYRAELRVEQPGRERQILDYGASHFAGLAPAAWAADGIAFAQEGTTLIPALSQPHRAAILKAWNWRRRMGKPLNVVRLLRAGTTFTGGARYLAWKVERHSGIAVPLTPFQERHPIISAPALVASYWRRKRRQAR